MALKEVMALKPMYIVETPVLVRHYTKDMPQAWERAKSDFEKACRLDTWQGVIDGQEINQNVGVFLREHLMDADGVLVDYMCIRNKTEGYFVQTSNPNRAYAVEKLVKANNKKYSSMGIRNVAKIVVKCTNNMCYEEYLREKTTEGFKATLEKLLHGCQMMHGVLRDVYVYVKLPNKEMSVLWGMTVQCECKEVWSYKSCNDTVSQLLFSAKINR